MAHTFSPLPHLSVPELSLLPFPYVQTTGSMLCLPVPSISDREFRCSPPSHRSGAADPSGIIRLGMEAMVIESRATTPVSCFKGGWPGVPSSIPRILGHPAELRHFLVAANDPAYSPGHQRKLSRISLPAGPLVLSRNPGMM